MLDKYFENNETLGARNLLKNLELYKQTQLHLCKMVDRNFKQRLLYKAVGR